MNNTRSELMDMIMEYGSLSRKGDDKAFEVFTNILTKVYFGEFE